MIEKRRNPRFSCARSRACLLEFPDLNISGRLFNMSRSGIAFRLPRQLRENALYKIDIRPSGWEKRIPCQARIVWVTTDMDAQTCICGARIVEMDSGDKVELLDSFYDQWKQTMLAQTA